MKRNEKKLMDREVCAYWEVNTKAELEQELLETKSELGQILAGSQNVEFSESELRGRIRFWQSAVALYDTFRALSDDEKDRVFETGILPLEQG